MDGRNLKHLPQQNFDIFGNPPFKTEKPRNIKTYFLQQYTQYILHIHKMIAVEETNKS